MPAPGQDDVGIDKQKILKNILREASEPAPAKPDETPAAPAIAATAPVPSAPGVAASVFKHRAEIATLILLLVGIVWILVGVAAREPIAYFMGGTFSFLGIISLLLSFSPRL